MQKKEIDSRAQFHQHSTYSFYARRSRMRKKRQSSQQCHLALLGTYERKSCTLNVGEIDTWYQLHQSSMSSSQKRNKD